MNFSGVTAIGLGNLLMQDEGIGIYIVNHLIHFYKFDPAIAIIDGGTNGIDLLPYFESSRNILIIDAVNFGRDPGHIDILYNDDILAMITSKLSLHHMGLADLLSIGKLVGIQPEEICLIGIQPYHMDLNLTISREMKDITGRIFELVIKELQRWNISCRGNVY